MSALTWHDRLADLRRALGREPTLSEKLKESARHQMTPEEIEAQRQSWVRAFTTPCEHGELDFEQCAACCKAARLRRLPPPPLEEKPR